MCYLLDRKDWSAADVVPTKQFLELLEDGTDNAANSSLANHGASDVEEGGAGQTTWPPPLLEGVTTDGDTVLHVLATCGDTDSFLRCACLVFCKAGHLLSAQNTRGETPLHCAARSGRPRMVSRLIALARGSGETMVNEVLRKENMCRETALHEAVRHGSRHMVELLMAADSDLARFPRDGASPLYLAVLLEYNDIARSLYLTSGGNLSYSGSDGQNALHAAVLRNQGMTFDQVLQANAAPMYQIDDQGSFPNQRFLIDSALKYCHAKHGSRRLDHFEEQYIQPLDVENESAKLMSSTQTLGLGSVLMATVTFGASFTLPGDYNDDGTPTLSGRYAFDAFIAANSWAFACAGLATINLTYSGLNSVDLPLRIWHFDVAMFFASGALTSLVTAYALGLYVTLIPVAYAAAVAICVVSVIVTMYSFLDPWRGRTVARALYARLGSEALVIFARTVFLQGAMVLWPVVTSFIAGEIVATHRHK
nr:unnamed protein product [Digitaria exilis]